MPVLHKYVIRQWIVSFCFSVWLAFILVIIWFADHGNIGDLGTWASALSRYDAFMHFSIMGFFSFFTGLLVTKAITYLKLKLSVAVWILLALSIVEETTQIFRVHRGFSLLDMAGNASGIILFGYLAELIKKHSHFYPNQEDNDSL